MTASEDGLAVAKDSIALGLRNPSGGSLGLRETR
jgi:hypothetical protein